MIWLAVIVLAVVMVLWVLFRSTGNTVSDSDDDDDLGALL